MTEGKVTHAPLKGDMSVRFYCMDLYQSGA